MKLRKPIIGVLALSVLVAACGKPQISNLNMATGGVSGTYYPFGGAMAQIWNQNVENLNVTAQSTGASAENIRLIGKSEVDLALVQNDVMSYAYNGTESFENEKITSFRTIATLYPEVVQIVAAPGISSIADLKGKSVSVGDAGSGVESNARQILQAYGITFNDIKMKNLSFSESATAYTDGQLDAFFVTAGVPNTAIQEVALKRDISVLSIDADKAAQLISSYPFYVNYTIDASVYNTAAPAETLAVKATLICREGLSEELVYNMTKTLFEKQPELAAAHAKGEALDLNSAVQGASVPFHAGAEKYYKEKGVQ